MPFEHAEVRRLAPGSFTLARYHSVQRVSDHRPAIVGANPPSLWGHLQVVSEGLAGALSPGRWMWFSTMSSTVPEPMPGFIATDFSPSIACYQWSREKLAELLSRHAPAAMDADILSTGYRRMAFCSWAIELVTAEGSPPIVLVPQGHAHNFAQIAATRGQSSREIIPETEP